MVRVKIIKPHKRYKIGETLYLTNNEAFHLLDGGFAIQSKDLTPTDYRTNRISRRKK